jgi:hypothetical protein
VLVRELAPELVLEQALAQGQALAQEKASVPGPGQEWHSH